MTAFLNKKLSVLCVTTFFLRIVVYIILQIVRIFVISHLKNLLNLYGLKRPCETVASRCIMCGFKRAIVNQTKTLRGLQTYLKE